MHQSSIGSTCSRIASWLARSLEETAWVIDDDNVSGRLRRLISIRSRMHCWDRRAVAIEHAMHESCINILHQCYTIMNKIANKKEYRWVYVKTLNSCCSAVQNNSSGSISTGANFNIMALALKEKCSESIVWIEKKVATYMYATWAILRAMSLSILDCCADMSYTIKPNYIP